MGHQGCHASRDIAFGIALPVIDGPAFAAYIREVLIPEIALGTVVILDNMAHQGDPSSDPIERFTKICWRIYDQRFQRDHRLRLGFYRAVSRNLQVADHLRWPGLRLGKGRGLPVQDRPGRAFGIEAV